MTLKQFFQLAAGAIIGLVLYASPIPAIFKWPLIVLSVLSGAAFAFLPLQERPLEQWMSGFIRSIYGPTIFIWQTSQKNVPYFAPEDGTTQVAGQEVQIGTQNADIHTANLEASEQTMLTKISGLFSLTPKKGQPDTAVKTIPNPVPVVPNAPAPQISQITVPQVQQQVSYKPTAQILSENKVTTINPTALPTPTRPGVVTPQTAPLTIPEKKGFETVDPKTMQIAQGGSSHLSQTFTPGNAQQGGVAQFSDQAAPPSPPTTPNIIVGQIMDSQGKIVEGAIMEIKDQLGRPVRALKTNRAGHFMIVTPLPSGTYTMFVEKDGLTFQPVNVVTNGTIISPIAIKAQTN
jgi:hypothetical protein